VIRATLGGMSGAGGRRGRSEPSVGRQLERTRAERGLSLEEAARATRIRAGYLEALEREDLGALPDAVYVPVLLKVYADYLGLEGEALARELKHQRLPERERRASRTHGGTPGAGSWQPRPDAAGSAAAGGRKKARAEGRIGRPLISLGKNLGAWVFMVLVLAAAVQALTLIEQPESRPAPRTQATADPLRVSVSVRGTPSWLRVEADGEFVLEERAHPGFSRVFEARREVQIATGNAGAVQVAVNGRPLGVMGPSGEVLTRTYSADSGR
jgi:cytoskeleton protein RodZ